MAMRDDDLKVGHYVKIGSIINDDETFSPWLMVTAVKCIMGSAWIESITTIHFDDRGTPHSLTLPIELISLIRKPVEENRHNRRESSPHAADHR